MGVFFVMCCRVHAEAYFVVLDAMFYVICISDWLSLSASFRYPNIVYRKTQKICISRALQKSRGITLAIIYPFNTQLQ